MKWYEKKAIHIDRFIILNWFQIAFHVQAINYTMNQTFVVFWIIQWYYGNIIAKTPHIGPFELMIESIS